MRKMVSGLIELLHPDGQVTKEEVAEYTQFGMEMWRRVKEQLRKIAGVEYWDVTFSSRDLETGKDVSSGKMALFRLEAQVSGDQWVRPDYPAGRPFVNDEGGRQNHGCLPQGAREGPWHHEGCEVVRLQHPGGQSELG